MKATPEKKIPTGDNACPIWDQRSSVLSSARRSINMGTTRLPITMTNPTMTAATVSVIRIRR